MTGYKIIPSVFECVCVCVCVESLDVVCVFYRQLNTPSQLLQLESMVKMTRSELFIKVHVILLSLSS